MCISKKLTHYSNDLYSKTTGRMDNSTKPYHDLTNRGGRMLDTRRLELLFDIQNYR